MNNLIYIVDVRNLILENESTLERHLKYADSLQLRTKSKVSLGVIQFKRQKVASLEARGNLQILFLPSNPLRIVRSLRQMKSSDSFVNLLVAGDPWESALGAYLLRILHFKLARTQIQIHGDIGNNTWINQSRRNFLRSLIAKITLRFANQIRTVGITQTNLLISKYRVPRAKCRIIPVTSLYSTVAFTPKVDFSPPPAIGFVGRLQSDRGVANFIELVAKLKQQDLFFSVVVAGEGPERKNFEIALKKLLPREKILFVGNLKPEGMAEAWSQIKVLVSTAPSESFGRAIREAISWGIPVWAIPSSGVRDLQNEVSERYVKNLDISLSAEHQANIFRDLLLAEVPLGVRESVIKADERAMEDLIDSWVELSSWPVA
jgi:glycosyltransferase involved in cell wall biosynthesis